MQHDSLLKDKAKANKVREMVDAKTLAAEKERGTIQKECDVLNISTAKLEADIPAVAKEIGFLKKEIKRQEHELELINRKRSSQKKGNAQVVDHIQTNENVLRSLNTELTSCKKATDELNKARVKLVASESQEEERLKQIYAMLKVSPCNALVILLVLIDANVANVAMGNRKGSLL